jgi:hypothetical protein
VNLVGYVTLTPAEMSKTEFRQSIMAMQETMMAMSGDQVELPLKHHFAPGSYARECFIPAGVTVIGKIHRHAHINIITRGQGLVATEFGRMEYDADAGPYTFISEPGAKRAVHALTDTIWTTFHVTEARTPEDAEHDVILPSYDYMELEQLEFNYQCLGQQ